MTFTYQVDLRMGSELRACDNTILNDPHGDPIQTIGMVNATADVRISSPIECGGGMMGSSVTDRVAPPGVLNFELDNSAFNSAGLLGYYSPDHANARSGFDVGSEVRVCMISGTITYYPFHGRIKKIKPAPGPLGKRNVEVICGDFMEQTSIHKLNLIPVQMSKRNDQLMATLIANMPIAPLNTSYAVGPDTFATAFNAEADEKEFANTAMQKCMQSDLGYAYVRGNAVDGETFVYESRQSRALNTVSKATLNDVMDELDIDRSSGNIWNTVKVSAFPDRYDASAAVLYSSSSEMTLNAGQSTTFTARFRDPAGLSSRTSVKPGTEVTPVADTDYKMSSVSNNGGNDLNASLTISVVWGGNSAEVTLLNTGGSTGYVQKGFQLRGIGIYHYDPVEITREDSNSQLRHGNKTLSFSLPYQGSTNVATDFANVILGRYRNPVSNISSVSFVANKSTALMTAALTCWIGDRITIVESVTGISEDFFINGVNYKIQSGGVLRVSWILESTAGVGGGWVLDDLVSSVLGTTTILGF